MGWIKLTDMTQNIDTRLGVPEFQGPDECPALFIDQDLSQCSNGPSFVPRTGDVFPELWVIFGHDLRGEIQLARGIQI